MQDVNAIKKVRFEFLNNLYDKADGSKFKYINMFSIGEELGLNREQTANIAYYLQDEGLVEQKLIDGGTNLTHAGIKEIEEIRSNPERSTEHFQSLMVMNGGSVNIINVETMNNSQLQQATNHSSQKGSFKSVNPSDLTQCISILKRELPSFNLPDDDMSEVRSDISVLEAQIQSSRPKNTMINESLRSIKRILEGAGSSVAASPVIAVINGFLGNN